MDSSTNQNIPDGLREVTPGVFYATGGPVVLADSDLVLFLKEATKLAPLRRARLCAHPDADADQHDMVIVSHRDTYVAPHRHSSKSETLLVLEGEAHIILFDEDGTAIRSFPMAPFGGDLPFFYRMPAGTFHSLVIKTEYLVFVESTKGPFTPDATGNAAWAPAPNQAEEGRAYLGRTLRRLGVVP